ncbi:MAG: hypothetical protein NVSMB17_18460 [Candidatus Dormibacteria bacterium]
MEPAPGGPAKRIEVSLVQRQHIEDVVSIREDNNRSISKPNIRVAILRDDAACGCDVVGRELFQTVSTTGYLIEKAEFRVDSYPGCKQIVEFGHHEG